MNKEFKNLAMSKDNKLEIFIYDEIGENLYGPGLTAKDFLMELKAFPEATEIELHINSPGGSVTDGMAIYNQLKADPRKKVCYVDGMAASIASVIAMACDEVIMPNNALMMIHNPWTVTAGNSSEIKKDVALLEKMEKQLVNIYAQKTKLDPVKVKELCDAETWMDGDEALYFGFATGTVEAIQVAASALDLTKITVVDSKAKAICEKLFKNKIQEIEEKMEIKKDEVTETAVTAVVAEVETKVEAVVDAVVDAVVETSEANGDHVHSVVAAVEEPEVVPEEPVVEPVEPEETEETVELPQEIVDTLENLKTQIENLQAQVTQLTADKEALQADNDSLNGKNKDLVVENQALALKQEKALAGVKISAKVSNDKWADVFKKYGYAEARKLYPHLYADFMKQNAGK
jgi:ATP-dependent protease ClpP protease subunit